METKYHFTIVHVMKIATGIIDGAMYQLGESLGNEVVWFIIEITTWTEGDKISKVVIFRSNIQNLSKMYEGFFSYFLIRKHLLIAQMARDHSYIT